jgi:hypothetical protein
MANYIKFQWCYNIYIAKMTKKNNKILSNIHPYTLHCITTIRKDILQVLGNMCDVVFETALGSRYGTGQVGSYGRNVESILLFFSSFLQYLCYNTIETPYNGTFFGICMPVVVSHTLPQRVPHIHSALIVIQRALFGIFATIALFMV